MGTGEENSPAMPSKPAASAQRETPTTPSYPDWSTSMQAYYGAGATPPPYFTSPVASPAPHPYVWGSQHLVTPYGTPLPYPALYPHGGLYAHPNMAVGAAVTNTETEGKASNGKDLLSTDKSKGTSRNTGLASGKSGERGKAASGSGNDGASQSAESASEGSSEASDENLDQASSAYKKRSFNQMLATGGDLKSNNAATNLNMGMDLWNASPARPTPIQIRASPQDERELKREKRKQSNRESARRSRLRKQAECEELQVKVQKLINENQTLRDEMNKLCEECENITSENNSIMEELTNLYGPDAMANLEGSYHNAAIHSVNGEQSSHGQDTSVENNSNSMSGQNGRVIQLYSKNHDS